MPGMLIAVRPENVIRSSSRQGSPASPLGGSEDPRASAAPDGAKTVPNVIILRISSGANCGTRYFVSIWIGNGTEEISVKYV